MITEATERLNYCQSNDCGNEERTFSEEENTLRSLLTHCQLTRKEWLTWHTKGSLQRNEWWWLQHSRKTTWSNVVGGQLAIGHQGNYSGAILLFARLWAWFVSEHTSAGVRRSSLGNIAEIQWTGLQKSCTESAKYDRFKHQRRSQVEHIKN